MQDRILIVEDSRPMREVTYEFLSDEGYRCDAVDNGLAGLEILEKEQFDLILTDLRLPGADGFEIVEKANITQPDAPKIIMTAFSEMDDALRALRLGAYDFLQKPIRNLWELGITVKRALEHRHLIRERDLHQAEIEAMNIRLEEEVKRRTDELSNANQALRTLDEMKNNLLANVSHELRTPLVSVRGYTELFYTGRLCEIPDDCLRYFETSMRNIDKLLALIESLVGYAELAREGVELHLEVVDLKTTFEELVGKHQREIEKKKETVRMELECDTCLVNADRALLEQSLHALIENAIKFNKENGLIEILINPVGKHLTRVAVKDSGAGIPHEEQTRIFERFYQIDGGATRHHGGTGMGLAIARDNLRLLGCELRVSSEPGEGSTFYFTIPLVRKD